jgi:hypothetical protein
MRRAASRSLLAACALALAPGIIVHAADDQPADSASSTRTHEWGNTLKRDAKLVGASFKEGAHRVAVAAKAVGHEISTAAKRGAAETRAAMKGEKGETTAAKPVNPGATR